MAKIVVEEELRVVSDRNAGTGRTHMRSRRRLCCDACDISRKSGVGRHSDPEAHAFAVIVDALEDVLSRELDLVLGRDLGDGRLFEPVSPRQSAPQSDAQATSAHSFSRPARKSESLSTSPGSTTRFIFQLASICLTLSRLSSPSRDGGTTASTRRGRSRSIAAA